MSFTINVARLLACVAGVRKGRARDRARGRRFLSFLPRALSRAQISASPFNACHAGYTLASIHNFKNNLSSKEISSHREGGKEGRGYGG